ncbi:MAG TPA: SDR family oxidoreductase [Gammaproteobacteria bacterium]|nr:SDR family oxidoreductase [Gammaproteobacteria bacterium]
MKLHGKNIVLTGANGGLGRCLAEQLSACGAHLALAGRSADSLGEIAKQIKQSTAKTTVIVADLLDSVQCTNVIAQAEQALGPIDLLINNAGLSSFSLFAEEDPQMLEKIIQVNLIAPMLLSRAILPLMQARGYGRIVNIGSTFGAIGFAYFSAYSGSKFGLRGFSEALRRELADSPVGISYIAPRAIRTALNTGPVMRMAAAVSMNMDAPKLVAEQVIQSIEQDDDERHLGFPERLFARINAVFPKIVSHALKKQNRTAATFAGRQHN